MKRNPNNPANPSKPEAKVSLLGADANAATGSTAVDVNVVGSRKSTSASQSQRSRFDDYLWRLPPCVSQNTYRSKEIRMQHPVVTDIVGGCKCGCSGKTCICVCLIILFISWVSTVIIAHMEGSTTVMMVAVLVPIFIFIILVRCFCRFGCIRAVCAPPPSRSDNIRSKIVRNFQSTSHYEKKEKILFCRLLGIIDTATYDFYIYEIGQNCKIKDSTQRRKRENLKFHLVFVSNLTQVHSIRCPPRYTRYSKPSSAATNQHFDIIIEYYNENNNNNVTKGTLNRYSVTRAEANTFSNWLISSQQTLMKKRNDSIVRTKARERVTDLIADELVSSVDTGHSSLGSRMAAQDAENEQRVQKQFGIDYSSKILHVGDGKGGTKEVSVKNVRILNADDLVDLVRKTSLKEMENLNNEWLLSDDINIANEASELDYYIQKYPKEMTVEYMKLSTDLNNKDERPNPNQLTRLRKLLIAKGKNIDRLGKESADIDNVNGDGIAEEEQEGYAGDRNVNSTAGDKEEQ